MYTEQVVLKNVMLKGVSRKVAVKITVNAATRSIKMSGYNTLQKNMSSTRKSHSRMDCTLHYCISQLKP